MLYLDYFGTKVMALVGLSMDPMVDLDLDCICGLDLYLRPLMDLIGPCSRKAILDRNRPLFVPWVGINIHLVVVSLATLDWSSLVIAILVMDSSYHDELWLDGWCESGSGPLSMRVLILLLLLVRLVIPYMVTLLSPSWLVYSMGGPWHNIPRCPARVNVPHWCWLD